MLHVARYLASTGDYPNNSPAEQERLLQDAEDKARSVYGLRAFAQFFAPSPPTPQFVVKDKDGNAMLALKLSEAYRKMLDDDAATATQRFVETFGEGAFLSVIPKSEGGGPTTDKAYAFARENPRTVAVSSISKTSSQSRPVPVQGSPPPGSSATTPIRLDISHGESLGPVQPLRRLLHAHHRRP